MLTPLGETIHQEEINSASSFCLVVFVCFDYIISDVWHSGFKCFSCFLTIHWGLNKSLTLVTLDTFEILLQNQYIWDALRDLVPFAQFKKREKHTWRSITFSKVAGQSPKANTPPWFFFTFSKLYKWYQIT